VGGERPQTYLIATREMLEAGAEGSRLTQEGRLLVGGLPGGSHVT
jgi:hypothetical protein